MALLHWQYQELGNSLCVGWVIVTLAYGISLPVKSDSELESVPLVAHHITKRATDKEFLQPPVSDDKSINTKQVPDEIQIEKYNGSIKNDSFQENDSSSMSNVYEEQTKIKQNSNDKTKIYSPQGGYVSKYINPDKKVPKLNAEDHPSKTNKSNHTILNNYPSDIDNSRLVTRMEASAVFKSKTFEVDERVNVTQESIDKSMEVITDQSNVTDFTNDDSMEITTQNITDLLSDRNNTSADGMTMPESGSLDIVMISGIGLGSVALIGLIAGGGFAVYRHRIWNKPQTLSDKCSNADSSGYIDDSTLRENSEEMYSLDNDSFLNSLEAMTIQNYWTDNVKHTKL